MALESIDGGFEFSTSDRNLIAEQRKITAEINEKFIKVGAVFLQRSSKAPSKKDWYSLNYRDTNLQSWFEDRELSLLNVGFNLQLGWLDIDIDSGDPEYNRCILAAMNHLQVDTRFAFGRQSKGVPSHVFVQLDEEDAYSYENLRRFEPAEFKIDGNRFKAELRSMATNQGDKHVATHAKQTVMPGSVYMGKNDPSKYDISVWYKANGEVAHSTDDVAQTTTRPCTFRHVLCAVAFGTVLYLLKPHWIEGSRQVTATKVSGWLARVTQESRAIVDNDLISHAVFCPLGMEEAPEALLRIICENTGDDEVGMRIRTFYDALRKLERNPDARIPGWPTMRQLFGDEVVVALQAVLKPGSDVSVLTRFAEQYIFEDTENGYIDRERFKLGFSFNHAPGDLRNRHNGDFITMANGKLRPAFQMFENSKLRKHVNAQDLYPDYDPGTIIRVDPGGFLVNDEDDNPRVRTVFNTWTGWPHTPIPVVNPDTMAQCLGMLDQLLAYLTRNNEHQAMWLKKWIAWIFQHPGKKQQVAPVIIGGQGIGKSFFGGIFLGALMKNLLGHGQSKALEGVFAIEPFINKMCVFFDEAKFHREKATDEIKRLIRNVDVAGSEKYQSARSYRIFARLIFASNRNSLNVGQTDTQDRALFYIKAYDSEFMQLTPQDYLKWTGTLKPFFDQFNKLLDREDVCQHYMRYFMELPVTRYELEDTALSSSFDVEVVGGNMSWKRLVAKRIIEEGRIIEGSDISTPFSRLDLNMRVMEVVKEMGMNGVNGNHVFEQFREAGVIESHVENGRNLVRFKYRIGTLTKLFGDAIGVPLEPMFQFTDEDFGSNDATLANSRPWKGGNRAIFGKL